MKRFTLMVGLRRQIYKKSATRNKEEQERREQESLRENEEARKKNNIKEFDEEVCLKIKGCL